MHKSKIVFFFPSKFEFLLKNTHFIMTIGILYVFFVARSNAIADYLTGQQQQETENNTEYRQKPFREDFYIHSLVYNFQNVVWLQCD